MAHININERREAVASLIKKGKTEPKDLKTVAVQFGCTYSAIVSDIIFLKSKYKYTVFPGKKVKNFVKERDNYTCQYCGKSDCSLIIDHVIPYALGGVGYDYNLVAACESCNIKKGKNEGVWVPKNILTLKALNSEWYYKIMALVNT